MDGFVQWAAPNELSAPILNQSRVHYTTAAVTAIPRKNGLVNETIHTPIEIQLAFNFKSFIFLLIPAPEYSAEEIQKSQYYKLR